MKASVAIVLILCGAILFCLPFVSDFLWGLNVAKASEATHSTVIGLPGQMMDEHRLCCGRRADDRYRDSCVLPSAATLAAFPWALFELYRYPLESCYSDDRPRALLSLFRVHTTLSQGAWIRTA